jgi:hypothetical protein
LRAAIWYAEDYSDMHTFVGIRLLKDGKAKASSVHSDSVFQKVIYSVPLTQGTWQLLMQSATSSVYVKAYYLIYYQTNCS